MSTAAGSGWAAAVCAAATADGQPGVQVALDALARVPAARDELDRAEAVLIGAARAGGAPWSQIAAALGLGSYQAAAQRAGRLAVSTGHPTNSSPPPDEPAETVGLAEPVRPVESAPAAVAAASAPAVVQTPPRLVGLDPVPDGPAATSSTASGRGRRGRPGRWRSLTAPSVMAVAQRRKVTVADFATDPLHDLVRTGDPGRWQVHDHTGGVLGEVRRQGRRWQATTPAGDPLLAETYPNRAEAALQVVVTHQMPASRHRGSTHR